MSPEINTNIRTDIAEQSHIETIGEAFLDISPDQLPWIDESQTIDTRIISSQAGEFQFGNIIGASDRLRRVADSEMSRRPKDDDRLNRIMYDSIVQILSGNPGAVKRFRNSPDGVDIFYGGLSDGSRIYFVDAGRDDEGYRTFLKAAVCGSKNAEPRILSTFSGNSERVKK